MYFFFIMMVPFLNAPNPCPAPTGGYYFSLPLTDFLIITYRLKSVTKLPGTLNIFRLSHKTQHIESQAAQIVEHQYYVID